MSRRSKSRNERVIRGNANRRLLISPPSLLRSPNFSYQDRRQFHPDLDFSPAIAVRSRPRLIVPTRVKSTGRVSRRLPVGVAFNIPREVLICARRKIRRSVMFAKGGAGSRKMSRPRRNHFSDVRC